jgi:AbiV family abortive infection protein
MAQRITNLKPGQCNDIFPEIAKNAYDLFSVAKCAAEKGKYGCATSLLILGAEEYSKAIIVMLHAHCVNIFYIDQAVKVFRDHKSKHDVASAFELLNLIAPVIKIVECVSKSSLRNVEGILNLIVQLSSEFSEGISEAERIFDNLDWWKNADEFKQKGFYSNYDDILIVPNHISRKEYDNAKVVVERLQRSYRLANIIFTRYPDLKGNIATLLNQGIVKYNLRHTKKGQRMLKN